MTRKLLSLALVVALLSGCASNPPAASRSYHGLYDGQPAAVFATELPASSAEEAMQRGDLALRQGNLDQALYLYVMALEIDDARPDAFYKIGRIHAYRGNVALAVKAYAQVLARAPDHARAHEELGLLLLNERKYDLAERSLQSALAADGRRPRVHNALGVIADLHGDHNAAAQHFEAALTIEPNSAQTLNNLGYSHYLAGRWQEAEQIYARALAIDPNHVLATRNLGILYARLERYDEALALLDRVMKPENAYNDIGYVAMLDGRHEQARTFLDEAVRLSPSYYETAYENLRRNEELARSHSALPSELSEGEEALQYDGSQALSLEDVPATAATARGWITAKTLDVRADALEQSELLDEVHRGKVVYVLARQADWLYVRYLDHSSAVTRERRGWIPAGHLTENRHDVDGLDPVARENAVGVAGS